MIISGNEFNQRGLDIILAPFTSQIRAGDPTQVVIQEDEPQFEGTGLKVASAIKCGAVFAYSKDLVRRRLGSVDRDTIATVRDLMVDILTND